MANPKPYSGTSHDRLTALVNTDNNTTYVEGVDFTFDAPVAATGTGGRNTKVRLRSVDQTAHSDSTVNYKRLPISALNSLPAGYVSKVTIAAVPFTIYSILPNINSALGLDLDQAEVVDDTYSERQVSYTLKIKDGSLAWLNSQYDFSVQDARFLLAENGEPLLLESGLPFELED